MCLTSKLKICTVLPCFAPMAADYEIIQCLLPIPMLKLQSDGIFTEVLKFVTKSYIQYSTITQTVANAHIYCTPHILKSDQNSKAI